MKIFRLADRVRTLVIALGLAMAASLGAPHVYAADAFKPDPAKQTQGMTDAPAIIATAHISCDPSNAYALGQTDWEKDGKKGKGTLYEIACKAGPGFMITKISDTEVYQPFTCTLAAKIQKTNASSILCVLPENTPHYKWLQAVVQPYLPSCEVTDGRQIGATTSGELIDRYEFACKDQVGGVVDYPQLGQTAKIEFKPCIVMDGGTSACTLSTRAQIADSVKPIATAADPKCQVNNARFVGVTKEEDAMFYEFGCANEPGFMVQTKPDNTYMSTIPCANATKLMGGCTYTDLSVATADANTTYTNALKTAGFTCTVKAFDVKGTQPTTKRDFVEFQCAEQPFGLIGYIPQPGSVSALKVTDCFDDQLHKTPYCTYVTADMLMKQWDKLIKLAEPTKGCDVTQVRYIGESDTTENAIAAELACANKRGYIAIVAPDRQSLMESVPCRIAKAHNEAEQCQIAGNGTYTEGD